MRPHLIMPMCGTGSRFRKNGYNLPKPIIEIEGKPFFYWAAMSIKKYIDIEDITFVVISDHVNRFNLDKLIYKFFQDAKIIIIPQTTQGPVFTCLEGLKNIKDNLPIIFNDCDHMFKCSGLNDLLSRDLGDIDGALVTFESESPSFSYVKYDDQGHIEGTVEKKVVSNHAICGAYTFKNAALFRNVAKEYLLDCPYEESFLSGMYNIMCLKKMKVKDFLLDFHVEFGTPEEYEMAKGSEYFARL